MSVDPDDARKRVMEEKSRVEGLIHNLKDELGDGPENDELSELSDYDQHPADTASETFEREKDVSILEQLEEELAELQAALERIDDGTYGVDEVTGEPIEPERLTAFPTARTNVDTEGPRGGDDRLRPTGAGDPEEY
jgi:RNA polymerase-binding transcription factor DksA